MKLKFSVKNTISEEKKKNSEMTVVDAYIFCEARMKIYYYTEIAMK